MAAEAIECAVRKKGQLFMLYPCHSSREDDRGTGYEAGSITFHCKVSSPLALPAILVCWPVYVYAFLFFFFLFFNGVRSSICQYPHAFLRFQLGKSSHPTHPFTSTSYTIELLFEATSHLEMAVEQKKSERRP